MQSYFVPPRGNNRRVLLAYCLSNGKDYSETLPLNENLSDLLGKSGLLRGIPENRVVRKDEPSEHTSSRESSNRATLPFSLHSSLDSVESLSIKASKLNAFKLSTFAAVQILWTNNISRHLLLSKHTQKYYLELFVLPCALQGGAQSVLQDIGVPGDLIDEIQESYANLFNPGHPSFLHRHAGTFICLRLWCWCLHCSSRRLRDREIRKLKAKTHGGKKSPSRELIRPAYDPVLKSLMERDPSDWDQLEFNYLWPRIVALESHLQEARPWSFWVIFRDRRDTVQYWTFLFGTIILILTAIQVVLGVAQVVGSF